MGERNRDGRIEVTEEEEGTALCALHPICVLS
jgi:hypothetical protein